MNDAYEKGKKKEKKKRKEKLVGLEVYRNTKIPGLVMLEKRNPLVPNC